MLYCIIKLKFTIDMKSFSLLNYVFFLNGGGRRHPQAKCTPPLVGHVF